MLVFTWEVTYYKHGVSLIQLCMCLYLEAMYMHMLLGMESS